MFEAEPFVWIFENRSHSKSPLFTKWGLKLHFLADWVHTDKGAVNRFQLAAATGKLPAGLAFTVHLRRAGHPDVVIRETLKKETDRSPLQAFAADNGESIRLMCHVHQNALSGLDFPPEPLKDFYNNEKFSDCIIRPNGTEGIHCSKLILASRSAYFRHMFEGDFCESQRNEVDADILDKCLQWIYTGQILLKLEKPTADLLIRLYTVADRLLILTLAKFLRVRIEAWPIDLDTVQALYEFAALTNSLFLKKRVWEFWSVEVAQTAAAEKLLESLSVREVAEFTAGLCLRGPAHV
ncbi:BTB/POZ protein [Geranomyces variabilis]|nr:BTB/POZ protein [Geranomyces variabilis]